MSKILGHAGIQVTLYSYAKVIDTMMLNGVKDLKYKLSTSKTNLANLDAHSELINRWLNESRN